MHENETDEDIEYRMSKANCVVGSLVLCIGSVAFGAGFISTISFHSVLFWSGIGSFLIGSSLLTRASFSIDPIKRWFGSRDTTNNFSDLYPSIQEERSQLRPGSRHGLLQGVIVAEYGADDEQPGAAALQEESGNYGTFTL